MGILVQHDLLLSRHAMVLSICTGAIVDSCSGYTYCSEPWHTSGIHVIYDAVDTRALPFSLRQLGGLIAYPVDNLRLSY